MAIRLAGCILLDEHRRIGLLHRRKNNVTQWELPGGKVEPAESDEAAATRELQEELGITVQVRKRIGSTSFEVNGSRYEYSWFLATVEKGTPKVCEPATFDGFQYFSVDELGSLELSANMHLLAESLQNKKVDLLI